MRFAFDIEGVILEMPAFFEALTVSLKAQGHEIFIVTNTSERYRAAREAELKELGIAYDQLILTSHKKAFMEANAIDYALDDNPGYYRGCRILELGIAERA